MSILALFGALVEGINRRPKEPPLLYPSFTDSEDDVGILSRDVISRYQNLAHDPMRVALDDSRLDNRILKSFYAVAYVTSKRGS